MKTTVLTAFFALHAAPAFAAPLSPMRAKAPRVQADADDSTNFKISFKIRNGELEDSGSIVVLAGSQSNFISAGEKAFEAGAGAARGVEFKKHGAIVNCVAVAKPATTIVHAECQFELSGPLAPTGELKARSIASLQFQTSFEVERGRTLVLVDGPSRLIEVKIEAVAP